MTGVEAVFVIAGLAFVVFLVAMYLLAATLRARVLSWVLGRVRRSMSWIGQGKPLTGQGLEEERFDRRGLFDAMGGRSETDAAVPRKRTRTGPTVAGPAVENYQDRDRK